MVNRSRVHQRSHNVCTVADWWSAESILWVVVMMCRIVNEVLNIHACWME